MAVIYLLFATKAVYKIYDDADFSRKFATLLENTGEYILKE